MSRSRKKSPVWTDGSRGTTKETKQLANRRVRRHNKRVTHGYLMRDPRYRDELTLDGMDYKKFFCSYDIHDVINYWSMISAIDRYEHPHWCYNPYNDEWWHNFEDYVSLQEFLDKYWKKIFYRK